jgi:hypothetical protein
MEVLNSFQKLAELKKVWPKHMLMLSLALNGVMKVQLLQLLAKTGRSKYGRVVVCYDHNLLMDPSQFIVSAGAQKMTLFFTALIKA